MAKDKKANGQFHPLKADEQLLVSKLNSKRLEYQLNAQEWVRQAEAKRNEMMTLLGTLAKKRGLILGREHGIDFNLDTMAFVKIAEAVAAAAPAVPAAEPEE